ncbi:septal ring lytic transglycosylase RlpA family protein [Candidatus Peregrinibacteria bacterium]|nr:septal ring lytic transglycosylase RlpA family protein [Candidatus Peregrinibacteria bacterium]
MNKIFGIVTISFIGLSLFSIHAFAAFSDIKEGDRNYLAITYLQDQGIITGYDDNTFKSGAKINRAEALKMIISAIPMSISIDSVVLEDTTVTVSEFSQSAVVSEASNLFPFPQTHPFPDTPIDSWYTPYIQFAKQKNIISGRPDGNFHPEENINLAESLKILLETAKSADITISLDNVTVSLSNHDFTVLENYLHKDTTKNEWFAKYTTLASSLGLLDIQKNDTINPQQEMTRGYLAEIIYRFQKSREGYEFGKATWYGLAVQGSNTASGQTFDANTFTAAHKYLPFNSVVEVTNLANSQSVEVRITDRGPYGPGRVLDLSSGAFKQIASLGSGIINVQYKVTYLP